MLADFDLLFKWRLGHTEGKVKRTSWETARMTAANNEDMHGARYKVRELDTGGVGVYMLETRAICFEWELYIQPGTLPEGSTIF